MNGYMNSWHVVMILAANSVNNWCWLKECFLQKHPASIYKITRRLHYPCSWRCIMQGSLCCSSFNKSMMLALLNLYLKAMPLILERNRVTHKGWLFSIAAYNPGSPSCIFMAKILITSFCLKALVLLEWLMHSERYRLFHRIHTTWRYKVQVFR